jgi:putative phosphoribosyl transferase
VSEPAAERAVRIDAGRVTLDGTLNVPESCHGAVLFAHGSGSSRHSPRNRAVAEALQRDGFATLLFDLLEDHEATDRSLVFDVELLAGRLGAATDRVRREPDLASRPVGYFGASTGAAAALWAAAEPGAAVHAVVSRGGRPDLAGPRLGAVRAPTLLVVGGADREVLALNERAAARMTAEHEIAVVPGATHLFEEPGALESVTRLAASWFRGHLAAAASRSSR